MKKAILLIMIAGFAAACGSETADNSNSSSGPMPDSKQYNSQPLDNSGKPIEGIPDPKNANISDKPAGATPTPGIPEKGKADITDEMKGKDIPGIPNAAERERISKELNKNPSAVNTAPAQQNDGDTTAPGPLNRPRKSKP